MIYAILQLVFFQKNTSAPISLQFDSAYIKTSKQ